MNSIKNILIAVELDKESETVIEYGITLGLMLDANVRCLHVSRPLSNRIVVDEDGIVLDDYGELNLEDLEDDMQEHIDEDLDRLRTMVLGVLNKMELDEHTVMTNVRSDFAVTGILTEAEETAADLIVVGAHVGFKRKDMSISNLSKEVILKSERSVIVVPSTYGNRNLDHIAMFVNFEFGELTMIQDMIETAIRTDMHLSFIHVLDAGEKVVDIEAKMNVYNRIFLQDEEHDKISFSMKAGEISDIIDELASDMDVDLIGIRTKKKHWNLFGLQQSFDTKLMKHIRVPLYIWKN